MLGPPAEYPSGLRGRIANPLFVGSNPTSAFQKTLKKNKLKGICARSLPLASGFFRRSRHNRLQAHVLTDGENDTRAPRNGVSTMIKADIGLILAGLTASICALVVPWI